VVIREWVVLLEVAAEVDHPDVAILLRAIEPSGNAVALHAHDRCAIQVSARGSTPSEVLSHVLDRWSDATAEVGLSRWEIVRTEVLTLEEFLSDFAVGRRSPCRRLR
jgi:hypothetical protein